LDNGRQDEAFLGTAGGNSDGVVDTLTDGLGVVVTDMVVFAGLFEAGAETGAWCPFIASKNPVPITSKPSTP
jgi:hypothetical protein